jgi:preprotein translocase subunit YajC
VTLSLTFVALAQDGLGSGLGWFPLQLLGFGLVFYFLILRPQAQVKKRHAELLGKLKKGDEVMTSGGIIGKVRDIKEVDTNGGKEVRVTVESGTASVVVERSRIIRVGDSTGPAAPPT